MDHCLFRQESVVAEEIMRPVIRVHALSSLKWFDAVGWVTARASGA